MSDMPFELHRVEGDEGAEVAAKLFVPSVTEPPMLEKHRLVGAREITFRAVVSQMSPIVRLHVRVALKDGTTGVMAAFHSGDPVHFGGVSDEVFTERTLETTTLVEAG